MQPAALQDHVFSTYRNVRYGLAIIGAAFPLLLVGFGAWHGIAWQNSFSAYYWASVLPDTSAPMRTWFVGLEFVLGALLYLYKGFSARENHLLNTAAVCCFGVALVPMPWNCGADCPTINAHAVFGSVILLCIALVSIVCATETIPLLQNPALEQYYRRRYRGAGLIMVLTPLTAFAMTSVFGGLEKYVFFVEAAGLWAFAYYWWIKSDELSRSYAELAALQRTVEIDARAVA